MPVNRYLLLFVLVMISLVFSVGSFVFIMNQPQPRARASNFLQLVEVIVAFGLLVKRADWACTWGMRWYLVKAVGTIFVIVGVLIGGGVIGSMWFGLGFALVWLGLAAFLYWNQEYFD